MSNKYVAMLIPASKIRRFASSVDDLGWLNLGYLVRVSGAYRLDKIGLLYLAFKALFKHHKKDVADISEAFVEYNLGNSELNEDAEFNEEFNEISRDIELLSVPGFYKFVAGAGVWMLLASFSVLFFLWWLIFILPPLIWFLSSWAKNMYQLNYMANLAILSHRSEPFRDFCRESGMIAELPDDLTSFRLIGNAFGGGEVLRSGENEWDHRFEFEIINGINVQNIKLSSVSNLMSVDPSR